jgi:S1-C subfamily serine protease
MNDSKSKAVELLGVLPGSPSEKAGLKQGDKVLSIDGLPISTIFECIDAISNRKGDMCVCVLRGAEIKDIIIPMSKSIVSEVPAFMNPNTSGDCN